jgi:hypothetical protein
MKKLSIRAAHFFASHPSRRFWIGAFVLMSFAGGVFSQMNQAQPQTMTKIVCQYSGPSLTAGSPESQPTTIYRAADKYERIELPPDPVQKKHELRITREPDAWYINLADQTAIHMLDRGPDFTVSHFIISSQNSPLPEPEFRDMQFGNEAIFARQKQTHEIGLRKIDNKDAKAYLAKGGDREAMLYFDPETDKPLQIDVTRNGKPDVSIKYLEYTELPFDPKMFELPEGIKVTEQK